MADDRKMGKFHVAPPGQQSRRSLSTTTAMTRSTSPRSSSPRSTRPTRTRRSPSTCARTWPEALGHWWNNNSTLFVNPTGSFIHGGPSATPASPAARSSSTAMVAGVVTAAARSAARTLEGRSQQCVLLPLRREAGGVVRSREEGRNPGRLRDRDGEAGVGEGRYLRHGRRARRRRIRDEQLRLPPARDHRQAEPAPPDLPQSTNYGHFGRPGLPWETVEKMAAVAK